MEIILEKTEAGWPLLARTSQTEVIFSGVFEKHRIFKEELNTFAGYLERGVLWILFFAGLICLGIQIPEAYKTLDWQFVLQKNFYNFFFWLSAYTTTYLWARNKYFKSKKNKLILNELESAPSADLYQYFSKESKTIWNQSFKIAKKRTPQKEDATVCMIDIFLTICQNPGAQMAFLRLGANSKEISEFLENYLKFNLPRPEKEVENLPFFAWQSALSAQSKNISPIFLLCGIAKALPKEHILQDVFYNLNIDEEKLDIIASWTSHILNLKEDMTVFQDLSQFKLSSEINRGFTSLPTPYLDRFSSDLTSDAKYGHLPITFGRGRDLNEIFKLISEGSTNLIIKGQEGSGRTTLINELAYKMASEQVPKTLSDKRLVALQISAILGNRQKAENVFINCLNEAAASGNIILIIKDIHTLAKAQSNEGFNFLELLINFLDTSGQQILGTTTIEEYTETLSPASNFASVFSNYELLNLSYTEILLACCVKASLLENHNHCLFRLDALKEAIRLSDSYNINLAQPQKAVVLLVEAATRAKHSKGKIIGKHAIQKIISEKTHVPEEALNQDESEKLLNLEHDMAKFIVGQTQALLSLGQALRRARSGLSDQKRPLASFLFLGPTGVGKTEVAKTLSKLYFGGEKFLLRLDMSEFQGQEAVEKFLGGRGKKASSLVSHIKNYPFCLLLIDEFEKASREIQNLFLQILDDGRLTAQNEEILDFTHALIIATSNASSREIQTGIKNGLNSQQLKTKLIDSTLTQFFTPELINRFDEVIVFEPLTHNQVQQIAILQLQYLKQQLNEKGVKMEIAQSVFEDITQNAFDPNFGARPIRRYIQDHIESYIAKLLLSKDLERGSQITLEMKDGQLTIS